MMKIMISEVLILWFAVICWLFVIQGPASAQEAINPFDTEMADNPHDISKLRCRDLYTMLKEKNSQIVPVIIWIHGLVSGLDGQTRPFSNKDSVGLLALTTKLCEDKQDALLFDLYADLKKREAKH